MVVVRALRFDSIPRCFLAANVISVTASGGGASPLGLLGGVGGTPPTINTVIGLFEIQQLSDKLLSLVTESSGMLVAESVMSQIFFDTHKFVRTLTEAGFPEAQAEALMEATRYALQESYAAWEQAASGTSLKQLEKRVDYLERAVFK